MTRIQRLAAGAAVVSASLAFTAAAPAQDSGFINAQFQMGAADPAAPAARTAIQDMVAGGVVLDEALRMRAETEEFYALRAGAPHWVDGSRLNDGARELIGFLQTSGEHGLDPEAYHLRALAGVADNRGRVQQGAEDAADALLTDAFLLYANHMLNGRVDPSALENDVDVAPEGRDLAASLASALDRDGVADTLRRLEPNHPQYAALKNAYRMYSEAAQSAPWPSVDSGALLRPGDRDQRVAQIRARLDAEAEFDGADPAGFAELFDARLNGAGAAEEMATDPLVYDAALEARVKAFQGAHNLNPDGIVGAGTLAMLNQGLEERREAIRMNLERWRWLPNDLAQGRYLLVNAPQYRLHGYEDGRETISMDVIVGRESRKTPQFSDMLEYLVVNPDWNVPYNIAVADKLPQLRRDPSYFDRLGYVIYNSSGQRVSPHSVNWNNYSRGNFPFRIVQRPGAANALGTVKFMFPNEYNVYLHDTDAPELFTEDQRSISSGCVRVADPRGLARWVTEGDPALSYAEVESAWESSATKTLHLGEKIPVHLAYFTAWVGDDGDVGFYGDIYGRDARLAAVMSGAS